MRGGHLPLVGCHRRFDRPRAIDRAIPGGVEMHAWRRFDRVLLSDKVMQVDTNVWTECVLTNVTLVVAGTADGELSRCQFGNCRVLFADGAGIVARTLNELYHEGHEQRERIAKLFSVVRATCDVGMIDFAAQQLSSDRLRSTTARRVLTLLARLSASNGMDGRRLVDTVIDDLRSEHLTCVDERSLGEALTGRSNRTVDGLR